MRRLFVANIHTSGIYSVTVWKPYGKATVAVEDWPLSPPPLPNFQSVSHEISVSFTKSSQ